MGEATIDAQEIQRYAEADALACVDDMLGAAEAWAPSLVAYRLRSEFQRDWKVEVGRWLLTARDLGFLDRLMNRVERAWRAKPSGEGGPNDAVHKILQQELAPAMTVYYFLATGWHFAEWAPKVQDGDVDVRLRSPGGVMTDIQVKASDQPGEVVGHRLYGGEYDERVLAGLDTATGQLRASPGPARMVVISPQRIFPIDADVLAGHLVGRAQRSWEGARLTRDARGTFGRFPGVRLSAVVDLGLLRRDQVFYRCCVFTNPWAEAGATLQVDAFPHARVCSLRAGEFVWHPGPPNPCVVLPQGTRYIEGDVGIRPGGARGA